MDLEQARRGSANVITVFAQGAPVDNLQPDADHDLKKGLPGTNKTLSHARDFDEGAPSGTTACALFPYYPATCAFTERLNVATYANPCSPP